tara:strand:- start:4489 stop:4776 length:288 start_codon:yes stop_codon:yes gene_type:complete
MVEQGINMEDNMDNVFKELRFMGNEDLMFNILDMQKKHIQNMSHGDKRDMLWRKFLSNVSYVEMKFEAELYSIIEDELDGGVSDDYRDYANRKYL